MIVPIVPQASTPANSTQLKPKLIRKARMQITPEMFNILDLMVIELNAFGL